MDFETSTAPWPVVIIMLYIEVKVPLISAGAISALPKGSKCRQDFMWRALDSSDTLWISLEFMAWASRAW